MNREELWISSTMDGSLQPSLFYRASKPDRPLLVVLHTWSFDRFNQEESSLPYAQKYDFNLLLPEFRGPNLPQNPHCTEACGSPLAKQDIIDAIDYVLKTEEIDAENVFLLGLSGGGHMTLLMAGLCPERFKAMAAFVPITDLSAWAAYNPNYNERVQACCSGDAAEMAARSPMNYIDTIAKANLKIFHGKFDQVVPVAHSLNLYDALMEKHPQSRVFLDIFDGGHEIDWEQAMGWILSQYQENEKVKVTG